MESAASLLFNSINGARFAESQRTLWLARCGRKFLSEQSRPCSTPSFHVALTFNRNRALNDLLRPAQAFSSTAVALRTSRASSAWENEASEWKKLPKMAPIYFLSGTQPAQR